MPVGCAELVALFETGQWDRAARLLACHPSADLTPAEIDPVFLKAIVESPVNDLRPESGGTVMTSNNDDADALPDLVEAIAEIGRMQLDFPGWLTGLYLVDRDIQPIGDLLTHDDPIDHSIGRYERVPVFRSDDFALRPAECQGEFAGIRFTYYEVDFLG